jgi:DNA modification methylase
MALRTAKHDVRLYQCPADTILVTGDRQRKTVDLEKIERLKKSIELMGLQHPIVIAFSGSSHVLVSGYRRLEAMRLLIAEGKQVRCGDAILPPGHVPCIPRRDLTEFESQVLELEENLNREDLSWQDRAQAVAKLHRIHASQEPGWTYRNTLAELGYDKAHDVTYLVRDQLLLADNLDRPAVAAAPTQREAMKILRREVQEELMAKLAEHEAPQGRHTLAQGDAIKLMQKLPAELFDVILTDPPYGIQAALFAMDTKAQHRYDDRWSTVKGLLTRFAVEAFRVAKADAHCYMFCDVRHFHELVELMSTAGWTVWPRPLVWVKDTGTAPSANYGPLHSYETILYALKGDRPVSTVERDVIEIPAVKGKDFAAQKPVDLYVNLLRRSAMAGDFVLDPFCGSGTIFRAAQAVGLTATGFDNDPIAIALAKEAMREL